ncbi:bifunctional 2-polyprenyl-6-hydroxyphenol methylase/3-demethylubiquinol 3-O-methyltransferase UbiG [Xenorhabdus sp. PB30.3]|uniref:class I SAM-dependent methyltransferase n=1 Tax=Xenorhabdus sp. PB30.3 TaxID=2788941 RepID=UPI001E2A3C18|nr:class I SAM-dependent methyltransferase [Xenorhabdus sp. PB30.3]MCC8381723.1 class I SAM-dependent methyltransferase [Xenorhabdus sp. PB30.3]
MWNERYSCSDYIFGTEPNIFLTSCEHLLSPGKSVLSVADGEGRNSIWLASQGLNVTAFDMSDEGLKKAKKLATLNDVSVNFKLSDIENWHWVPEQFDIVVAIFIQFAPPEMRRKIFEGMKTTLRPGGMILMQGYRPEQLEYGTGGPRELEYFYTRTLLEEMFGDFRISKLDEYDSELQEGTGHSGLSALIDLVAFKPS